MVVIGVLYAGFSGQIEVISPAAFAAAEQSVGIFLEMAGILGLWMGLLNLAEKSGFVNILARGISPIAVRLFPDIPRNDPAMGAIVMNMSANLLGLGNAATPFGIKAMEEMARLNGHQPVASNSMITFLVLNTSSVTLIPATVIGLRTKAGAANGVDIVLPTFLATVIACTVGLLADRFYRRWFS
ncbi:MAG: spore maturation protein [Peptococcaceae bacterium]|nr:spore maturation protein [Peptococcaceae bacterium]